MRRRDRDGGGGNRRARGRPARGPGPPEAAGPEHAAEDAVRGYWHRRGLSTGRDQLLVAPGAPLLLLALFAALGGPGARGAPGAVLLPRPCASWYAPQARLLGRPVHPVPVPPECGGVPDPFALLEAVRRARAAGDDPRVLVLAVVDGPTGTAAPPELLHEVCEAAVAEGLHVVSDETLRDTLHDPHGTVVVSPAEMLGTGPAAGSPSGARGGPVPAEDSDFVTVLTGLGPALPAPAHADASGPAGPDATAPPAGGAAAPAPSAGVARFPGTGPGGRLRAAAAEALTALRAEPGEAVRAAVAGAFAEPEDLRARRTAAARTHGLLSAVLARAVTEAGAFCRPPRAGRHLYADLEPLRPWLAARDIRDSAALEAELVRRLGPHAEGGHRFGDDPRALRVRLSTGVLAPYGRVDRLLAPDAGPPGPGRVDAGAGGTWSSAPGPSASPALVRAGEKVQSALSDLAEGSH